MTTVSCRRDRPTVTVMPIRDGWRDDIRCKCGLPTLPDAECTLWRESFGKTCRCIVASGGPFSPRSDSRVSGRPVPDPVMAFARYIPIVGLPGDTLMFRSGSRCCETGRVSQTARHPFGATSSGWSRAQAMCGRVNHHIRFDDPQARSTRTTHDACQEEAGMFRDHAHLAIAFCRCMNIPARYLNACHGDIGAPMSGLMDFSPADGGVSGWPLAHLRCAQQPPAHRQDRCWPRSGRYACHPPTVSQSPRSAPTLPPGGRGHAVCLRDRSRRAMDCHRAEEPDVFPGPPGTASPVCRIRGILPSGRQGACVFGTLTPVPCPPAIASGFPA